MKRGLKWLAAIMLLGLLLSAAGGWALQRWLGSADFKARVEREAVAALGVGLTLERIDVSLWPQPTVVLSGVAVQTRPVLTMEQLAVRPDLSGLFSGRLALGTVLVRGVRLPQAGIESLLALLAKEEKGADRRAEAMDSGSSVQRFIPQRVVLEDVTWMNAKSISITLNAEATLDARGVPDALTVKVLKGFLQGASARLLRTGEVWNVALKVAGGTVSGPIEFQAAKEAGGVFSLKGQLETRDVEVAALSTERNPVLRGGLDAHTELSARTGRVGALAEALRTQSTFTVKKAVIHGLDLATAVKTVGMSRGGETALDLLAGQVTTRGRAVELNNLVASSGVLSASGNVAVAPSRALSGRVNVNLAASTLGSAVGVPLVVGGTLDAPQVTLSRAALIGAAIGTVVMPGVGTGAGASMGDRVGDQLKKLFGN